MNQAILADNDPLTAVAPVYLLLAAWVLWKHVKE